MKTKQPSSRGRTCLYQLASADNMILHIGKRLKEERTSRGLSMRGLAKLAGCSVHSVRNAELFISAPHLATLASLCLALDLNWHDLLGDPLDHRSELVAAEIDKRTSETPPYLARMERAKGLA